MGTRLASVTFQGTIAKENFGRDSFGDYSDELVEKYLAGGRGRYTFDSRRYVWTKQ